MTSDRERAEAILEGPASHGAWVKLPTSVVLNGEAALNAIEAALREARREERERCAEVAANRARAYYDEYEETHRIVWQERASGADNVERDIRALDNEEGPE